MIDRPGLSLDIVGLELAIDGTVAVVQPDSLAAACRPRLGVGLRLVSAAGNPLSGLARAEALALIAAQPYLTPSCSAPGHLGEDHRRGHGTGVEA